jgi:tetratricopeptide (TPR) repeat protein
MEARPLKCPECKCETDLDICPSCGFDISISKKIISISDRLYNEGLKKAQAGDLSGAIELLGKSLGFYKRNVASRNLLGLVYGAYGRLGEALRQWVISYNYNLDDNEACEYVESVKKNYRNFERQNESVRLYNKALVSLGGKSEDMAIIQLKRAVDINPNFVDALNLLSLCYINSGQTGKAFSAIKRVLEIDSANQTARKYLDELGGDNPRTAAFRLEAQPDGSADKPRDSAHKFVPSYAKTVSPSFSLRLSHLLFLVAGALLIFIIYNMYVMPPKILSLENENQSIITEMQKLESEKESELSAKDADISGLKNQISELEGKLAGAEKENELQQRISRLNYASNLLLEQKYEEAVVYSKTIDLTDIPEEFSKIVDDIAAVAYPIIEKENYTAGYTAYNRQQYAEAKQLFLKSVEYSAAGSDTIDDSYYYLGRIADDTDKDYAAARIYYEKVVTEYPSSNQFYNARYRLNILP